MEPPHSSALVGEVDEGEHEEGGAEERFERIRGPGPPERAERLDVDPGRRERTEGRHQAERDAEDEEEKPREPEGSSSRRPRLDRRLDRFRRGQHGRGRNDHRAWRDGS